MVEDAGHARGERPAQGRGARRRPPGCPAVADDTGLEVDALGGAPGVRSARYAGEDATYADNRAKLLARAGGRAAGRRGRRGSGRVALVRWPDGREVVRGRDVRGHDRRSASGATAASATTRSFVPVEGDGRTFARDDRGREARAVAPRPGLPGAGGCARSAAVGSGSPAPEVDGPGLEDLVAVDEVEPLVLGHRGVDVGGPAPGPGRRRAARGRPSAARR